MPRSHHQQFVADTQSVLLDKLAYSRLLPVGSWANRFTRPDILILQEPMSGRPPIEGKHAYQGLYEQAYLIECKVDGNDLEKAPYQLLMAALSFEGQGLLDLHHGGIRPVLAIPTGLRSEMVAQSRLNEAIEVFRELRFGFLVVDVSRTSYEALLTPTSFIGH